MSYLNYTVEHKKVVIAIVLGIAVAFRLYSMMSPEQAIPVVTRDTNAEFRARP